MIKLWLIRFFHVTKISRLTLPLHPICCEKKLRNDILQKKKISMDDSGLCLKLLVRASKAHVLFYQARKSPFLAWKRWVTHRMFQHHEVEMAHFWAWAEPELLWVEVRIRYPIAWYGPELLTFKNSNHKPNVFAKSKPRACDLFFFEP